MTKKMLAILGLSTLGAACGHNAPSAPTAADLLAPEASGSGAADALAASCKAVLEVRLSLAPPSKQGIEITASYVGLQGAVSRCPAPTWSSQPDAGLAVSKDPFKVLAPRIEGAIYAVTATAPSGLSSSTKVRF